MVAGAHAADLDWAAQAISVENLAAGIAVIGEIRRTLGQCAKAKGFSERSG